MNKFDWQWDIESDGTPSFTVTQLRSQEPVLTFSWDVENIIEDLAEDAQRAQYEADPSLLDDWKDMMVMLKMLTAEMERFLK